MHFYFENSIAFTGIATTAFDVKGEAASFVTTFTCT
jgi:hypothetical protein